MDFLYPKEQVPNSHGGYRVTNKWWRIKTIYGPIEVNYSLKEWARRPDMPNRGCWRICPLQTEVKEGPTKGFYTTQVPKKGKEKWEFRAKVLAFCVANEPFEEKVK
jgi:hypothetical protein